ncbi:GNAT family N-acetyltransferase [Marinobacter hydrocarbonoclasticus]|nr:GNAT family N-acetyltransferase [Marinobacter nauticus]
MEIRPATVSDIDGLVRLQQQCHIGSLSELARRDGFLNTVLDSALLIRLIESEGTVFVAAEGPHLAAMAVCASWRFWRCSAALTSVANRLDAHGDSNDAPSSANSYFWGPVCVDPEKRGQGIFDALFHQSRAAMSERYRYVYTYVHQDNPHSIQAHSRKAGFDTLGPLELEGETFITMARKTV